MSLLKISADKLFRIFFSVYIIWIALEVSSWYSALKYVSVEKTYNQYFLVKLSLPVALVLTGTLLKITGWKKVSNFVMGVPAVIAGSIFIFTLGIWFFLAIAFILFGKQ